MVKPIGKYEEIGAQIGCLVDKKQKAYGRSFDHVGSILRIIYPSGIKPEQYDDLGGIIRTLDKFFRIATEKNAFGEDPWKDVAGYALLMNRDMEIAEQAPVIARDDKDFAAPFADIPGDVGERNLRQKLYGRAERMAKNDRA